MLLSLKDFDIDIFLRMEDSDIFIYYVDFETIPQLENFMPLGSFDDDGKMRLISLNMPNRINVGMEFLHRDLYAEYDEVTKESMIRVDRFIEQFSNIPEVVDFFEPYLAMCDSDTPPDWCTECDGTSECPDYCSEDYDTCAISIPMSEFLSVDSTGATDYTDLYYIIVLYFNGIYRTSAKDAQEFGTYDILTDINFEINTYSLIINIKEFFTREFIYYLKCSPGSLPFANEYGTDIKHSVQTKNFIVRQLEVEAEINAFINGFNQTYGSLVQIKNISLSSRESNVGADSWLIEVFADVQQDRLVYRLEL